MAGIGEVAGPARGESGAMTDYTTIPAVATRTATAGDLPALSETLALAFHDDPVFRWWIGDDARRREILPAFFGVVAGASGEVHVTEDLASGAVWTAPGAEDDDEMVPLLAQLAAEHADRMFEILELMAEQHPADPHWYLFFLGTRPDRQARGLGSAVMRPVLETCDADAMPAYLEATSERSRELYARHGFEVVGEIRLPDGPSLWPMWRD
jgi:ribosomal protein S18 acetylase RimI-like enzyme